MLLVVGSAGCGPADPEIGPAFVEVAQEAGIEFHHQNGASGRYYYVETYGSGAAFLDYDNDGDQDLYAVNSAPLPGFVAEDVPTNAFYRNRGDGTFADVTAQTRTGHPGYGMGTCVGDIDNDGHVDLYVTNFGPNVLYRNQGDGTFADQTADAGVGDPRLSTSAAFADIDNDGDLDLYVANNVSIDLAYDEGCHQGEIPVYCAPTQYKGESGALFRNDRGGKFADITRPAGVYSEAGRQLGVVFGDYDGDGDADLYVANDMKANFLFPQRRCNAVRRSGLERGGSPQRERSPRGRHGHGLWRLRPGRRPRPRGLQLPMGELPLLSQR